MFPDYQHLIATMLDDRIALIALNRPDAANALNTGLATELEDAFHKAGGTKKVRVIILTGQGKHFCAGADLKERKGMSEEAWHTQHTAFEKAMLSILHCAVPVIAAVDGAAMGGGLEIALACDFIYATPEAKFALTEATLGIMPGLGGTQQLPRRIGIARAKEYLFTGKSFSGEEAYQLGMVSTLCTRATLLDQVRTTAKTIAANAPLAIAAIKNAVRDGATLSIDEAFDCELSYYDTLLNSKDRHEGVNAFNEKRKPVFTGE